MRKIISYVGSLASTCLVTMCLNAQMKSTLPEPHRPQFHFTPKAHWMNDPNGMILLNGTYHLFFQYYPDSTVWGPMHWGHATSKDMISWQEQPIALYPDSLGYIFSGSAVLDQTNSSGFGINGKAPLVAIFTQHDPVGEKGGSDRFQYQSIAYSNDEGKTWTKYKNNPVLPNPGTRDFRDPKVSLYAAGKKWIMTMAAGDQALFYSSPDLKNWTKLSSFGKTVGAHGGVWECPDLFTLNLDGKEVWVLLVSINPGGPNGGSATQYFTGSFDGLTFVANDTAIRFIDYGTDNYAGVTFSNTGSRKTFMGWMSNWLYAQDVPTKKWRSAMTLPRELHLKRTDDGIVLCSLPVNEFLAYSKENKTLSHIAIQANTGVDLRLIKGTFSLKLSGVEDHSFEVVLYNNSQQELVVGFDKSQNEYYIERKNAGDTSFKTGFANRQVMKRLASGKINLTLISDVASVELFADDGTAVMTSVFFPGAPMNHIKIRSKTKMNIDQLSLSNILTRTN